MGADADRTTSTSARMSNTLATVHHDDDDDDGTI